MSQVKVGTVSIDTGSAKVQRKVWNNPLEAIRAKCIDCSGGSTHEVRICSVFDCPQWRCRMGVRPNTLAKTRPELLDPDAVAIAAGQQFYVEARGNPRKSELSDEPYGAGVPHPAWDDIKGLPVTDSARSKANAKNGSGRTSGVKTLDCRESSCSITSPTKPSAPLTDAKKPDLEALP